MKVLTSLPEEISFREPVRQHPTGDQTVSEVAKALEKKYHILKLFTKKKNSEIRSIVIGGIKEAWRGNNDQDRAFNIMQDNIRDLFRQFILANETGIVTKASVARGNQSFIDTGAYYSNLGVKVQ